MEVTRAIVCVVVVVERLSNQGLCSLSRLCCYAHECVECWAA